jgi:hypothetical protein
MGKVMHSSVALSLVAHRSSRRAAFQTVHKCARVECGADRDGWLGRFYLYTTGQTLKQTGKSGQVSEYALASPKDQQFLTAKRTSPEGDAYASVYVATNDFRHLKETFGQAIVLLDVIETMPMETRMVTVDAAAMAKGSPPRDGSHCTASTSIRIRRTSNPNRP